VDKEIKPCYLAFVPRATATVAQSKGRQNPNFKTKQPHSAQISYRVRLTAQT